jgi:hypothetical protein
LEKFGKEGELRILIFPDWQGQSWSYTLKRLNVKKTILGKWNEVLQSGFLMKKWELNLPLKNLAVHLLGNPQSLLNQRNDRNYLQSNFPLL